MKRKIMMICFTVLFLPAVMCAAGNKDHEMPPVYEGSVELQKIKSLAGRWSGVHEMEGKEMEATVNYAVTSNGSAVVETLAPGTPHEMVSIYSDEQGKLTMTHYCTLANAPKLDLVSSDADTITLDFSDNNVIDASSEQHMHGLKIIFNEDGSIRHDWSYYAGGEKQGNTVMKFSRVK